MEPLEKYKRYVTSFGNLENAASANSVHTLMPATWLSGVKPGPEPARRPHGDDARPGDRREDRPGHVAAVAGSRVRNHDAGGGLPVGAGCYYSSTLSFRDAHRRCRWSSTRARYSCSCSARATRPQERDAIAAPDQQPAGPDLRSHQGAEERRSVASDRAGARRVTWRPCARSSGAWRKSEARDLSKVKLPEAPVGELDAFDAQVKMMFDLVALAYQANLTRVASYIMVAEGTNRTYNHIGVPDSFHPLSHHANDRSGCEAREDPELAHGAVRGVPRQDGGDAGWRRLAARPFDIHVRLEHEQQRPAQQLSAADHSRRWRQRQA